ncbi:DUF2326 domain-containing protein [Sphingomonas rubra]|uniref:Uncharacterized protein YydD, contains DUF2326 domain n=1 Tax=Sphingomonas rubra TaxID=634430 RepID=A0A1I5R9Q1_9SPHN|nr:DUF2326 domain-containing protein [Sphingomonas rubra]SFP55249.1 Uncharacterized protein YydD, contains DUF2326 domain [Sphingomonas rubra]
MIYRVWSTLPTFREVVLAPGMNVILADRADESSDKESRNGLGKTTLLRIIHFCLGSDFSREKVLTHPKLNGVGFGLEIELFGQRVSVLRSTSDAKWVTVTEGANLIPELTQACDLTGEARIPVQYWTDLLGRAMFGLPEKEVEQSAPTFRGLIGYFARVGRQAFNDPFDYVGKQKAWVKRTQIAYLLGLNWRQTYQWHILHTQLTDSKNLIAALNAVEDSHGRESLGDLEATSAALHLRLEGKSQQIASFRVRDDYHYIERQLGQTDRQIHALINENFTDRRLLDHYRESMDELGSYVQGTATNLLRQAGAVFKEESLRSIEDVAAFHHTVYEHRRQFLESETSRIAEQIEARSLQIERLSARKTEFLSILSKEGALDTFLAIQQEYRDLTAECERVDAQLEERRRYERQRDFIELQISQLRIDIRNDFEGRQEVTDAARRSFSTYTGALYDQPGLLIIELSKAGLKFDVAINREGSDGVDQMTVFCFDLTLANAWRAHAMSPSFLIHDSSLFADVDARQKARALKLAAAEAERLGFQYICCLNSDTLPVEHFEDFQIEQFVRLRLSDASPSTRLLGIELPPHLSE